MKNETKDPTLPEAAKELAKAHKRLETARKSHWESIEAMDAARREVQGAEVAIAEADGAFVEASLAASRKRFGLPEQMIRVRGESPIIREGPPGSPGLHLFLPNR